MTSPPSFDAASKKRFDNAMELIRPFLDELGAGTHSLVEMGILKTEEDFQRFANAFCGQIAYKIVGYLE